MSPKPKPPRKETAGRASERVALARYEYLGRWVTVAHTVAGLVAFGLVGLMLTPLAHAIAGKQTSFNVTISVALGLTFAATTAATGTYAVRQKRRADRAESRYRQVRGETDEAA